MSNTAAAHAETDPRRTFLGIIYRHVRRQRREQTEVDEEMAALWPGQPSDCAVLYEELHQAIVLKNPDRRRRDLTDYITRSNSINRSGKEWRSNLAWLCVQLSWLPPPAPPRPPTAADLVIGHTSTPRCAHCPTFETHAHAQAWIAYMLSMPELSKTSVYNVAQLPNGHWFVERTESIAKALWRWIVDIFGGIMGLALRIFGLALILGGIGWGVTQCGGKSNCSTEWDGRVNATYCE